MRENGSRNIKVTIQFKVGKEVNFDTSQFKKINLYMCTCEY